MYERRGEREEEEEESGLTGASSGQSVGTWQSGREAVHAVVPCSWIYAT